MGKRVPIRWDVDIGFSFWLTTQGHQPDTIRHYKTYARNWLAWLKDHDLDYARATRYEVSAYLGELSHHLRPGSLDNVHGALRVFYDYLQDEDLIEGENPARRVPRPRSVPKRATQAFTLLELKRLHGACRDFRERAVLMILLCTALRRSEIIQVTREAVDWDTGIFTVLGKGRKYRRVQLSPSVLEVLKLALAFDDKLWPWTAATLWRMVQRLGKRAGLEGRVHPHRFRATGATFFLDLGGSLEELQYVLGHESLNMSAHYAQAGRERRAIAKMAQVDLSSLLLET